MADNRGGYQRPGNPSPVSGPGKLSKRTDGFGMPQGQQAPQEVTGLPYGENQEVNQIASEAPLAAAPVEPIIPALPPPINSPSAYPDQPVTAGSPVGPGPNRAPTTQQQEQDVVAAAIRIAYAAAPSPQLRSLVNYLEQQGR